MTDKALAVIFARGTGDEVPMSSARLLAGKSILHYIIEAAQRSAYVSAVYVSTEDERIAAVATAAGAQVIRRPEELAQSTTPLTAAVEHAAYVLGDSLKDSGEHLLCLPADAVFCSTSVIDQALETYFLGDYDRLVALLPERKKYVIWGESTGQLLRPVVSPPHLRTIQDRLYSEPGILTVWRVGPDGVNESSERVGYVPVDAITAFRVDTEDDLVAANRMLQAPRLALRCDGSREMGMGHVMRLLNIAEHIQKEGQSNWDIRFFVGSGHLEGARLITERGFDADIVNQDDPSHWVERVRAFNASMVINDLPLVPAQYTEGLGTLTAKSITLVDSVQDIEPSSGRLDTVISLLEEDLTRPHENFHAGPAFATFDPSVRTRLENDYRVQTRDAGLRILVSFGTGDPAGLTQPTLAALSQAGEPWELLTVLVQPSQQDETFWDTVKQFQCPVEVVDSPSDRLGEILNRSDLALLSGGISTYEASALGVPAIVLCQNLRETARMEQFERIGSIVLLGLGKEVTQTQLIRTLIRVTQDAKLRARMSASGRQTVDGHGVDRIIEIVQELFGSQAKAIGQTGPSSQAVN